MNFIEQYSKLIDASNAVLKQLSDVAPNNGNIYQDIYKTLKNTVIGGFSKVNGQFCIDINYLSIVDGKTDLFVLKIPVIQTEDYIILDPNYIDRYVEQVAKGLPDMGEE